MTFPHTCGCFSARPLISEVYFGRALVPTVPYSVSLCLRLTNCALSHNTPSAFNYCLKVSGLRVRHSTGSLHGRVSVACVHVQLLRFDVQNVLHPDGALREVLNSMVHPPSCSSRITADLPRGLRNHFGSANCSQGASGKVPGMCRDRNQDHLI